MSDELVCSVAVSLRGFALADPQVPLVRADAPTPAEKLAAATARQMLEEREHVQRVLSSLTDVADELRSQEKRRMEEMQAVAVELAVAVASRLVHERIAAGDFAVETLVHQAAEQLKTNLPVTVFVHPQDLDLLEKRLTGGTGEWNSAKVRVLGDASLARGDCRAEAGEAGVRCLVQEQLAGMRRHLLDALPEATQDRRQSAAAERSLRRFPDRRHTA